MVNMDNDFYEDDEPIEKIRAIWENSEKGRTAPPRRSGSATVNIPGKQSYRIITSGSQQPGAVA